MKINESIPPQNSTAQVPASERGIVISRQLLQPLGSALLSAGALWALLPKHECLKTKSVALFFIFKPASEAVAKRMTSDTRAVEFFSGGLSGFVQSYISTLLEQIQARTLNEEGKSGWRLTLEAPRDKSKLSLKEISFSRGVAASSFFAPYFLTRAVCLEKWECYKIGLKLKNGQNPKEKLVAGFTENIGIGAVAGGFSSFFSSPIEMICHLKESSNKPQPLRVEMLQAVKTAGVASLWSTLVRSAATKSMIGAVVAGVIHLTDLRV